MPVESESKWDLWREKISAENYLKSLQIQVGIADQREDENRSWWEHFWSCSILHKTQFGGDQLIIVILAWVNILPFFLNKKCFLFIIIYPKKVIFGVTPIILFEYLSTNWFAIFTPFILKNLRTKLWQTFIFSFLTWL